MTDELALRRDADRAARADRLLKDETFIETLDGLGDAYFKAWLATNARDTDGRERLWLARTVLTRVREDIATLVSNGKIAMHELAVLEARDKREGAA
jgi:hypothetical protein